jgi:hypothetical protein
MPQEYRRVTLTNEELHAALLGHVDAKAVIMALGKIQAVSIERDRPQAVTVYCGFGKSSKKVVDIPTNVVVSAVIAYCKDHSIPLPRRAQTCLAADGNCLSLIKTINPTENESEIHLL